MLIRRTKLRMIEKVSLLNQFLVVDVNPFSSTESGRVLKSLQTGISKAKKAKWDRRYCANQLSAIDAAYKSHMGTPGQITRGRQPGSSTFGFLSKLDSNIDLMIGEFESEKEVKVASETLCQ